MWPCPVHNVAFVRLLPDHKNEQNTAALYGIIAIYCSVVFVYFSFDSIICACRLCFKCLAALSRSLCVQRRIGSSSSHHW